LKQRVEDSEDHHQDSELTKELTDVFVQQEPCGRLHARDIGYVEIELRSKLRA